MGAGKTLTKLAAIRAAIGGAIFFWRKTHPHDEQPAATPPFRSIASKSRARRLAKSCDSTDSRSLPTPFTAAFGGSRI